MVYNSILFGDGKKRMLSENSGFGIMKRAHKRY